MPIGIPLTFYKVTKNYDFTFIIKFKHSREEIHVHPTGHINLKINSPAGLQSSTIFIHDPLKFPGAQSVAIVRLPISSNPKQGFSYYNLFVGKHEFFIGKPLVATNFAPELYAFDFVPMTNVQPKGPYVRQFGGNIWLPTNVLTSAEVDKVTRYEESHRINRGYELSRCPAFTTLPKVQQAKLLDDIARGGFAFPLKSNVFEAIHPKYMRVRPKLGAKGKKFLIELKPESSSDPDLDDVRTRFKLKQRKGGHYVPDLNDVEWIDFNSEL